MNGFSTVDGFVVITECLAEMIKYVANEPSVGLFYVQQHTQNAVPNVIALNRNLVEKSRDTTLHTEDMEDSIAAVRSMKDCGFPIVDEMITDIRNSLTQMSKRKPRRGLIHNSTSSIQMGRTLSWGPTTWARSSSYGNDGSSYLSSVFKSATQKANILKWPQLNTVEQIPSKSEKLVLTPNPTPPFSNDFASTASSIPEAETDELPLSSEAVGELHREGEKEKAGDDVTLAHHSTISAFQHFDDFRAGKEARLELWLEETESKMENANGAAIERRL